MRCDPIGIVWDESTSAECLSSLSDAVGTLMNKILDHIPFGCTVEVGKAFLIDNNCALIGIICIHSIKLMSRQTQQSR